MYISAINSTNLNFGLTSKVRIPMKDGTTTLLYVTGHKSRKWDYVFTRIVGDKMWKGKVVGQIKEYNNKNGFGDERLAVISEEIGIGAEEPDTVVDKIIDSIARPNVDYNA